MTTYPPGFPIADNFFSHGGGMGHLATLLNRLASSSGSSEVWREVLLHQNQLLDGSSGAILQSVLGYIATLPAVSDTFILTDGFTTETWTFKAARAVAFEVARGSTAAAAQTNLVAAIVADSTLWKAVETNGLDRYFAAAPVVQMVVSRKAYSNAPDRVYGAQTTVAGIKIVSFTAVNYGQGEATEANIPATDPGGKTFGFGRAFADLKNNEAHVLANSAQEYQWNADRQRWQQEQVGGTCTKTTAVARYYADGTLGNDNNDGLEYSTGTGDSFTVAAGVVTFVDAAAAWTAADVGRLFTVEGATSFENNGAFLITSVDSATQIKYANADGVTEAFTGSWSVSSPKKTLAAAYGLIPDLIEHNTALCLSGTFTDPGTLYFMRAVRGTSVGAGASLLIDGGAAKTLLAGPFTSTATSTSILTDAGQAWTVDQWAGYWVTITSGALKGQTRLIISNTATGLVPVRNFTADPGVGCTFKILRPTTRLQSDTTGLCTLVFGGSCMFGSLYQVQRLYVSGTKANFYFSDYVGTTAFAASHVVNDTTLASSIAGFLRCVGGGGAGSAAYNPFSFAAYSTSTGTNAGLTVRSANPNFYVFGCVGSSLASTYIGCTIVAVNSRMAVSGGTRVKARLTMQDVGTSSNSVALLSNSSNYAATKVDSSPGAGIDAKDSTVWIGEGVDISSNTTHGILANRCRVHLDGAVVGTGNGAFGVYAHSGSVVHIKDGAAPTLTGTSGDLSTDGTTQASTWAAIDGGTPVADLNELTMAKQVA